MYCPLHQVFYFLTYENSIDLERIEDVAQREGGAVVRMCVRSHPALPPARLVLACLELFLYPFPGPVATLCVSCPLSLVFGLWCVCSLVCARGVHVLVT